MSLFTGLSAFPLTPMRADRVDEAAFAAIMQRLVAASVDSITALGSTGSYAYLTQEERASVTKLAVDNAGDVPVFIGVGALRTSHMLENISVAERAGAAAVLVAPVSYQPLTHDEVFDVFRAATERSPLPVIVYDNPRTTHFTFDLDLYARIAALPGIASIKIPGVPGDPAEAEAHVSRIRAVIPPHVTIGVSGDQSAATGLVAGCDAWYSVLGGTLPDQALALTRAAQSVRAGDPQGADRLRTVTSQLAPLLDLFTELGGSLRPIAAVAELLGYAEPSCLPLPVQGLGAADRDLVARALDVMSINAHD